jgi:hypothetical protein
MDPLTNQTELANYFAEALIDQSYKDSLDEAGFNALKQDLVEKINREISQTIFDNLSDEQLAEMEELLEEGDSALVSEFLRSAIPDLRRLILEKLINLKENINL